MPIDKLVQKLLDHYDSLGVQPVNALSPQQARQQPTLGAAAISLLQQQSQKIEPEPVYDVHDQAIPGPGGEIPIRIYRPAARGPFGVLVYFHGGGWVLGDLDTYDASCRALTNMAQCLVVSVDYRKAPEQKFPAAVEDAFAATQWVIQNAASLDGDPQRVAVGGESAGANLAAVVCLRARTERAAMPIYQVLIYPITNYAFDTASYEENANGRPLNRDRMRWFWNHYLPNDYAGEHPYASPLREQNLSGLPPAVVITAEYDPLRDEGEAYAQRLRDAGVPVVSSRYHGMVHNFFGLMALLEPSRKALAEVSAGLRSAFSRAPELARTGLAPQGAQVAATAQTKEGVQVGSIGQSDTLDQMDTSGQAQENIVMQSTAQMAGSQIVQRDAQIEKHPEIEHRQMVPQDMRAPGTPITPADTLAEDVHPVAPPLQGAGHVPATPLATSIRETASVMPPDTRAGEAPPVMPPDTGMRESAPFIPPALAVQESAPVIPADEAAPEQERAPVIPEDEIPPAQEHAPVIPADQPVRESAPVIPGDKELSPTESVIPADQPVEASAPVIPSDMQAQPVAPVPGDFPTPGTAAVPGDIPMVATTPPETSAPVRVGMLVVDAQGNTLGQVKAVRADDFVIGRSMQPDLIVPFYAIYAAGEQVTLNIPASQADTTDWSQPTSTTAGG